MEGTFTMYFTEQAELCYYSVRAQYALEAAFRRSEQGRKAALERDLLIAAKYMRKVEEGLEDRKSVG